MVKSESPEPLEEILEEIDGGMDSTTRIQDGNYYAKQVQQDELAWTVLGEYRSDTGLLGDEEAYILISGEELYHLERTAEPAFRSVHTHEPVSDIVALSRDYDRELAGILDPD